MPTSLEERVHDLLRRLPAGGLAAAHSLICDTLHYPQAGERLSRAGWPAAVRQALAADPILLARCQADGGPFDVLVARVAGAGGAPLSRAWRAHEHAAVAALAAAHPHALWLFTGPGGRCCELVSALPGAGTRPVLRRIVAGAGQRPGAAARRLALLDLASMPGHAQGRVALSTILQRLAAAFDAESLRAEFLARFAALHARVRDEIAAAGPRRGAHAPGVDPGAHAQALLDRLLVLYFLQQGGWLGDGPAGLYDRFLAHHAAAPHARSFHRDVFYPLAQALAELVAGAPGADLAAPCPDLPVSNGTYAALFGELFEAYDLTLEEETAFDQTVAIGPEMLGKVFESLVLPRERDGGVDRRRATGSYYTPRPVVDFMCRQALAEYVAGEAGVDRDRIGGLLALPAAHLLTDTERQWLSGAFSAAQAQHLRRALLNVRACDPAAGSGAFLIGLLQVISNAVEALDRQVAVEALDRQVAVEALDHQVAVEAPPGAPCEYRTKRALVERCLHGVDVQPGALRACALRLWLSLLACCQPAAQAAPPAGAALALLPPLLPDLAHALREGDGLLERLGNGYSRPFRWRDDFRDVFEARGGFDLMIGNPPYGASVSRGDWAEIKTRYVGASRARNSAAAFLALPFDCLHERGVACQIVPKSVTFSAGWSATRRLIWETGSLVGSADVSQAFEGVLLEQEVLLYRVRPGHETRPRGWTLRGDEFVETHRAPLAILKRHDAIMNHLPPLGGALVERLAAACLPLGMHTVTRRGAGWQAHLVAGGERAQRLVPVLRGRDVRQFGLAPALPQLAVHGDMDDRLGAMAVPKIVSQNIIAHITQPYDTLVAISALDTAGLAALDTVNMTFPRRGCPFPLEFVVALLNSSFARWYFYFVIYNRAVRTMHFDAPYVGKLPLPPATAADVDTVCALSASLARAQAGEEAKYFLHGQHPAYDALDAAIFRLYSLSDREVRLVLRET